MKQNLNEKCYKFFLRMANPTRIAILELLREGVKNVTEISAALNQEQSMISHNFKLLERCRFVFFRKKKEEILLLPQQRTDGADNHTIHFPRKGKLPYKRTMPSQPRIGKKGKQGSIKLYIFGSTMRGIAGWF